MENILFNNKAKNGGVVAMKFYKIGGYVIMYDAENDAYVCSCPSFTYRKVECKHIKLLKMCNEDEKEERIYEP